MVISVNYHIFRFKPYLLNTVVDSKTEERLKQPNDPFDTVIFVRIVSLFKTKLNF